MQFQNILEFYLPIFWNLLGEFPCNCHQPYRIEYHSHLTLQTRRAEEMIQKFIVGVISGTIIGVFITSIFVPPETSTGELFLTKITTTSTTTGLLCSIYAHLSKSKLQVFVMCILIGMLVFYIKYWLTVHDFNPGIMGTFTGAIIGAIFAIYRELKHSYRVHKRLKTLRKKGFSDYN